MESVSLDPGEEFQEELTEELEEELLGKEEKWVTAQNSENEVEGEEKKKDEGEGVELNEEAENKKKEWATAQNSKNNEKEVEKCGEKEVEKNGKKMKWVTAQNHSEGFGNGGFGEQTEKVVEVLLLNPETSALIREYVVCQLQSKGVVLVYPNPSEKNNFPYFIFLPDVFDGKFDRPLLPGDRVFVEDYAWVEGKEHLDKSRWIYAEQIRCQATVTKVDNVIYAKHHKEFGLITAKSLRGNKEVGAISVAAFGMKRAMALYERQCMPGLELKQAIVSDVIEVQLAKVAEGWMIGSSYILPQKTPVRQGTEFNAGAHGKIPAMAGLFGKNWPRKTESGLPIIFPFVSEYTEDDLVIAEKVVAAALTVAAETEEMLRLQTQFKGVVGPVWDNIDTEEEFPRFFWLRFETSDRKHVKKLVDQWTIDSPVAARKDYDSDAFAQGQVLLLKRSAEFKNDDAFFVVRIKIKLNAHEDNDSQMNNFRSMLHGEEVLVQATGTTSGYAEQAACFGFNSPSIIAKQETPRAEMLRALLGRPLKDKSRFADDKVEVNICDETLDSPTFKRLNEEQKESLLLMECRDPFIILQQAPPGTGKTKTLASAIDLIANNGVAEDVVVATATSNLPITKMVEETKALGVNEELIAFFSGTARIRYAEQISALESDLLRHKLTDTFLAKAKEAGTGAAPFKTYKKQVVKNPMRAQEAKIASRYLQMERKKIMFATTSMATRIPEASDNTTHLLIDEATQVPFTCVVNMVCMMPNLKKVFVTGDIRQLGVHLSELPEAIWAGFGLESVTTQLVKSPAVPETVLRQCYRSHGALVNCISYASYELHGEEVVPVGEVTQARTALTHSSINLPIADIPLVLLHSEGRTRTDETSFSVSNEDHNRIARELVYTLDVNLPKEVNIIVICLYLYERELLVDEFEHAKQRGRLSRNVEVHTVDSFQAKEADIIVLVTTRSGNTTEQTKGRLTSDFFKDSRRATVALSRARDGMFLIGDFRTLQEGPVWQRFLTKAQEFVPIFTDEYLGLMESTKIRRVNGILANVHGYSPIERLEEPRRKRDFRSPREETTWETQPRGSRAPPNKSFGFDRGQGQRRELEGRPSTSAQRNPNEKPLIGKMRMRTCHKCGEQGHIAKNCRQ
ncbi:hypothetical protein niasHS_016616 [Heterodera schachtii]|uniref:CCHC-type domain-containing protein n=1 Tax=Heterodera schachtii TaxID=97005 RepID=A0ABD2I0R3_HETSC